MAKKSLDLRNRRVLCPRCGASRSTMTHRGHVLDATCGRCRSAIDARREGTAAAAAAPPAKRRKAVAGNN